MKALKRAKSDRQSRSDRNDELIAKLERQTVLMKQLERHDVLIRRMDAVGAFKDDFEFLSGPQRRTGPFSTKARGGL